MPTNFVIGQILMLLAFQEVKAQKGRIVSFPFLCILLYSAFIFVPVAAWFFYHNTAWSEVYLRPEASIPSWAGPGFFLQYFTGMFFGGLIAQSLIQQGRTWLVFFTLILGILWLATTWGFTFDQYLHLGSFAEYHMGNAKAVVDDSNFQLRLNVGGAIMAVPLVSMGWWFFTRSQKISRTWFR